jgi:hypothetical protein
MEGRDEINPHLGDCEHFANSAACFARAGGWIIIGISVAEMREVVSGWSAKRKILGPPVFGDQAEHIGSVEHTR